MATYHAEEFCSTVLDKAQSYRLLDFFLSHHKDSWFKTFLHQIHTMNMDVVFAFCESPIEIIFWNSIILGFAKSQEIIRFIGPTNDFEASLSGFIEYHKLVAKRFASYEALSETSKPKTFTDYLEAHGVPPEESKVIDIDALFYRRMGWMSVLHVGLQPTLPKAIRGRTIRPDAIAWVPRCRRRVVVECDGFETHGTKDSFISDRLRDRELQSKQYLVRRYSGSEIRADPINCPLDLVSYCEATLMRSKK